MLRFGRPTAQCKINLGSEIKRLSKREESSGNKETCIDDIPEDWKLENGKMEKKMEFVFKFGLC